MTDISRVESITEKTQKFSLLSVIKGMCGRQGKCVYHRLKKMKGKTLFNVLHSNFIIVVTHIFPNDWMITSCWYFHIKIMHSSIKTAISSNQHKSMLKRWWWLRWSDLLGFFLYLLLKMYILHAYHKMILHTIINWNVFINNQIARIHFFIVLLGTRHSLATCDSFSRKKRHSRWQPEPSSLFYKIFLYCVVYSNYNDKCLIIFPEEN